MMKKNKTICAIIALTLIIAITIPVTALAVSPNYAFSFEFDDLYNHFEPKHEKGDSEQRWYVTLHNNGENNMSSANILGLKMNRNTNNVVDVYHTFSNYVSNYPVDYKATVYEDDLMYLGAKKDSESTSSAALIISGLYNP